MRKVLIALSLAAMLVVAGCSTVTDPGNTSPSADGTPGAEGTSDDPSDQDTPSPTPGAAVPGVEDGVLQDSSTLLDAQAEALEETGYAANTVVNMTIVLNETTYHINSTHQLRAEAGLERLFERSYQQEELLGSETTTERWANDSMSLTRERTESSFGDETTYEQGTPPNATAVTSGGSTAMAFFQFGEGNFEVVSSETTDGGERVVLEATEVNQTAISQNMSSNATVESFHVEATVDEEGRIRSMTGEMVMITDTALSDDARYTISVDHELTEVGGVEVDRPAWIQQALENITVVDVSATVVDGKYVEVTNEGSDPIPAEASVSLVQDGSGFPVGIGQEVAPGESFYVYTPEGAFAPEVAFEKPTEAAETLSGTYTVEVTVDFGTTLASTEITAG